MANPSISSRTPLRGGSLPLHSPEKLDHSLFFFTALAGLPCLRRPRQQASFLALLALILLTTYVFLLRHPERASTLVLRDPETRQVPTQLAHTLESMRKFGVPYASQLPKVADQIRLSKDEELAAVSSFLASLPQNQIPSSVDPSSPIDPQLVLDFDTRGPRASKEVSAMVDDVWSRNPVFLYSKHYSSASREVKSILASFRLKPSPTIIDVDTRDDADVLVPILHRLTSIQDFPILIIAGKPVGTLEDIRQMNTDGMLRQMISQSGALIDGAKRRKHRKH